MRSFKKQIVFTNTMTDYMIETSSLTKAFKEKIAVRGVNLLVPKGSIYALLGPNGAGKTTTIRMILGLLAPSEGNVTVNGIETTIDPKLIRGQVGLLPQYSSAYVDLTPMQNIKFILKLNGQSFEGAKSKLAEYFEKLEITEDLVHKKFSKLSGGEQRAFSFIMAVITDKDILILDEPTSGLDITRAKYIRSIIKDLVEEGKTVLLSSHIVSDLEELAEYCGILKEGELIFQGTKDAIIDHYASDTRDFEDAIVNAFKTPLKNNNSIQEVIF